jgi:hypothetical protein
VFFKLENSTSAVELIKEEEWSESLPSIYGLEKTQENLKEDEIYLQAEDQIFNDGDNSNEEQNEKEEAQDKIDCRIFFEKEKYIFEKEYTDFTKSGFLGRNNFYFAPNMHKKTILNDSISEQAQNSLQSQITKPQFASSGFQRSEKKAKTLPPKTSLMNWKYFLYSNNASTNPAILTHVKESDWYQIKLRQSSSKISVYMGYESPDIQKYLN